MRIHRKHAYRSIIPLFLVIAGSCGGPTPAPTPSAKTDVTKVLPPVKSVKTKAPEITIESADGKSSYVVRAKESEIHLDESGPDFGTMTNVEGEILNEGKVVSRFNAPSAKVDKDSQVLELSGGVEFVGEIDQKPETDPVKRDEFILHAANVKYLQGLGRIEAEGAVTVTSEDMVMGPVPKLWATADLRKIATPGKFK